MNIFTTLIAYSKKCTLMACAFAVVPVLSYAAIDDGTFSLRTELSQVRTFQLNGSEDVLQVKPVFEAEWINTDGNQNQQAIAYANNRLYLCINPYEMSEHPFYGKNRPEGSLYIRCIDTTNGTYSPADDILLLPSQLPSDFQFDQPYLTSSTTGRYTSYYTICSDSDGQLIAALASVDFDKQAFRNLRIILYPVNVTSKTLDFSGRVEIAVNEAQEIGSGFIKEIWMERISDFEGSLKSGNFSFSTMVAVPNLPATQKFAYKLLRVESTDGMPQVRQTLLQLKEDTGRLKSCENPDIDFWKANPDQIIVSHSNNRIPTVYFRDAGAATPYSFDAFWTDIAAREYCRGQYTISIGGHSFMIAGTETTGSEPQARCMLFQLPNTFEEDRNAILLGTIPEKGFAAHSERYPYRLRQLYDSKSGGNIDSRVIYAFSPGCGLGIYELSLITDHGGLENIVSEEYNRCIFDGQVLKISNFYGDESVIKVFDIMGRNINADVARDGNVCFIDLSAQRTGVYIISLPSGQNVKIHRKD